MEKNCNIDELLDFLLQFATVQMGVGVQTSRIIRNTARIAETYGYRLSLMMSQKTIGITLVEKDHPNVSETKQSSSSVTSIMKHKTLPLNFYMNSELSALSWYVYDNRPVLKLVKDDFKSIISYPKMSHYMMLLLISIANACFCRIFGGDAMSMLIVFVATATGFYIRQQLTKRNFNHMFIFVISAFIASLIAGLCVKYGGWTETPEIALSSCVLYLIPGVHLINSVIDLLDGYVLNGVSRFINAVMLLISMTVGLSCSLIILNLSFI